MADEWKESPFGELLIEPVRNGIYKTKDFHGRGAKIVNMGELFAHPRLHAVPMKRVELNDSEAARFMLAEGDLIFARRSLTAEGAGKCCVVLEIDEATTFESSIIRARPDKSKVDSLYLYYFFNSPIGFNALDTIRRQVAVAGITGGDLAKLNIPVPPLPEQRAIAHILGTLDDKIELNRRANETLESMARTLFKAWFVDFEPVRAKLEGRWQRGQSLPGLPAHLYDLFPDRLVESELGEIPEGWQTLPVYGIATYVNGAAFKAFQPNDYRRGLPIIKIAELKSGITAQTKFSDVVMPEKYRLITGDILFSWSGNPDTSIDTFIWPDGDAWLNQHIFRVDVHSPGERSFVVATLKYLRPVFAEIARNKQTTGLGHVTVGDMQRLHVIKPDGQVLAAWDRMAAPILTTVFGHETDSISLGRLRDTLLPKLISGELRVKDAEAFLKERGL